jgi:hypothetical protein
LNIYAGFIKKEKIAKEELYKVISPLASGDIDKINMAFEKIGTERLTLIFEHFESKYPYDDLRIVRAMLK